jgi:uncharacterized protein HemX
MRTRRVLSMLALGTLASFFAGASPAFADLAPSGNVLAGLGLGFVAIIGAFILGVALVAFLIIRTVAKKKQRQAASAPQPAPPEDEGPQV